MKLLKKFIFLMMFLLAISVVTPKSNVHAATSGHYTYKENSDGTITITKYDGTAANNLVIPSTIDGNSVTIIEDSAFFDCSGLTGSLTIPNSVKKIGLYAFENCSNLEEIKLSGENTNYSSQDGVLFNKDKTILIKCPEGKKKDNYSIPNSVTIIEDSAFFDCSGLTGSLTIPNSVTSIRDYAFCSCSGLTGNLIIPNSVKEIGLYAFEDCSNLEEIKVSGENTNYSSQDGVLFNKDKTILIKCPEGKKKDNYSIPNSVTIIEDCAFYGCSGLTGSLTIPNSMTSIGDYAFCGCSGLTGNLTIPNSVKEIGFYVFEECSNLEEIKVSGENTNYSSQDGVMFNKDKTILIKCPEGKKKDNYSIPNSVTIIEDSAFCKCSGLTSIIIPNSVQWLGFYVFDECDNLNNIIFCGNAPWIYDYTFSGYNKNIYYPMKKTGYDGEYWPKSQMEAVPFPDVIDKNEWYYAGAKYALENEIITGYNDGRFAPSDNLTRGQVATILYRMEGKPKVTVKNIFPDVPSDSWCGEAVQWAYENKIITGYLNLGTFGPGDNITRQDLALMLMRYAKYKEKYDSSSLKNLTNFADYTNVSGYATDGMKWAVGNGIISGNNGGTTIDPFQNATRAQAATMIMRFCKNVLLWE